MQVWISGKPIEIGYDEDIDVIYKWLTTSYPLSGAYGLGSPYQSHTLTVL